MKRNQEESDKEMTDTQPEPEIDVEAAEDSGISEAEAEEFETAKLKVELEEMEDRHLQACTEVANMVNQGKNEHEQLQKYRLQDLVKELLPSTDDLECALAIEVSDDQGVGLKKGVEMVLESLYNALEEEGTEKVPAKGEALDPSLHQVTQAVPVTEDTPAGMIVEVLQEGYKLHDHVLGPTMVIVAQ